MKNFTLLLFLLFTNFSIAQKTVKINFLNSIDYSFSEVTDRGGLNSELFEQEMPLGYSFDLSVEFADGSGTSILSGLRYSKRNLYPELDMAFYYGGRLFFEGDTLNVGGPRLTDLQFQTISIPIAYKFYFKQGDRFSFNLLAGMVVGFKIHQKEIFKDGFNEEETLRNSHSISAKGSKIQLFNTALEVGGGACYKINNGLNLLFQTSVQLFDFRNTSKQIMGSWPYGSLGGLTWWDKNFLPIGQISIGLGLQKSLSKN